MNGLRPVGEVGVDHASIRKMYRGHLMGPVSVVSLRPPRRAIGQERRACAGQQPDHWTNVERWRPYRIDTRADRNISRPSRAAGMGAESVSQHRCSHDTGNHERHNRGDQSGPASAHVESLSAMHWKHPTRPGVTFLTRANLIFLEVVDTASDTVSRGHSQCSADGIAVLLPSLNTTRPSTDTAEHIQRELKNRPGRAFRTVLREDV
jgi:hypothetical protein